MIAVVAVAVVLRVRSGIERRRVMFRQRAAALERPEWLAVIDLSIAVAPDAGCVVAAVDPEAVRGLPVALEGYRRTALYYRRMRQKYERAARYPWLPVESDPPEPR